MRIARKRNLEFQSSLKGIFLQTFLINIRPKQYKSVQLYISHLPKRSNKKLNKLYRSTDLYSFNSTCLEFLIIKKEYSWDQRSSPRLFSYKVEGIKLLTRLNSLKLCSLLQEKITIRNFRLAWAITDRKISH